MKKQSGDETILAVKNHMKKKLPVVRRMPARLSNNGVPITTQRLLRVSTV